MDGYTFIKLNNTCNNLCNFCADDWSVRRLANPSFIEIKEQVLEGKKKGFHKIIISGGEPTISPILLPTIELARAQGYDFIHLVTNGRRLSNLKYLKLLLGKVDRYQVSFFSPNPETFDKMTNVKGSFKQTLLAMKNLRMYKQNVIVNAVITKQNYKELSQLLILLYSLDVNYVQFAFINPVGFVKQFFDEVFIDYSTVAPEVLKVIKTSKEIGFSNIGFENFPPCIFENYKEVLPYLSDFSHPKSNKKYYTTSKVHTKKCEKCKFKNQCEGVFKEYFKVKGDSELKTL